MNHRDIHPLAYVALDLKTFGGLDVLEVNPPNGGHKTSNNIDQSIRIGFVNLKIQNINPSKGLEQYSLALHARFRGQGTNVSKAEHGGTVSNDPHQIATTGVAKCILRV